MLIMKKKLYNEKEKVKRLDFLKSTLNSEWEISESKVIKTGEPIFFIEFENYQKKIYGHEVEYENGKLVFIVSTDKDEFSGTGETLDEAISDMKEKIEKSIQDSTSLLKLLTGKKDD